jgi:hypothetical protein
MKPPATVAGGFFSFLTRVGDNRIARFKGPETGTGSYLLRNFTPYG